MKNVTISVLTAMTVFMSVSVSAFASDEVWQNLEETLRRADTELESGDGASDRRVSRYETAVRDAFYKARMAYEKSRASLGDTLAEQRIRRLLDEEQVYRAKMMTLRTVGQQNEQHFRIDMGRVGVPGAGSVDTGPDDPPTEEIDFSYGNIRTEEPPSPESGRTTLTDQVREREKDRPSSVIRQTEEDGQKFPPVEVDVKHPDTKGDYSLNVSSQPASKFQVNTVTNILGPGSEPGGGSSGGFPVDTDGSD